MNSRVSIQKRIIGDQKLLLEQFRKTPIVETSCQKVGIGRSSYYRWRAENKDFALAADEALSEGIRLVNDFAESQLLSAIKEGNLTAVMYWLNNRHSAYRNKLEVTTDQKKNDEPLNPEQERLMKKALAILKDDSKKRKFNIK